ncbi:MAG: sensor histidine kinase [Thermoleophilia bacterium]
MEKRKTSLKPLREWATGLTNSLFVRARLRLALFYILVMVVLLTVFSTVLYFSYRQNIQNNFEEEVSSRQIESLIIERTLGRLQQQLILIDGLIVILVGGIGYWLAGKTLKPIKGALDAQKRFAADASHELRTPLTIMKTSMEVALRGKLENIDAVKALLASNLEEVERMSHIVEDLLQLSRIDNDQERLQLARTDLTGLTMNTIDNIGEYASRHDIKMISEIEKDVYVFGDADKLRQALLNIIKNAIDYSRVGGEVQVSLKKDNSRAQMLIRDDGIGISGTDLPHIFERFYRADKSRSGQRGNSGLGLGIVKWIVEKHNGEITVKSRPGSGTTVFIILPLFSSS